jgi:hypothetical protein
MSKGQSAEDTRTPQEKEEAQAKAEESARRKAEQAIDGKAAMAEYEAAVYATRAKTEKLRELRLAREAAEKEAEAKKAGG